MRPIVFNGKFYAGSLNGVHRVADRLIHEVDRLLAGMPAEQRPHATLLLPRRRCRTPELAAIELRDHAFGHTQIWEQLVLPWKAGGSVLVNLCNLAPLLARRRITLLHDAQFMFTDNSYPARQRWGHRLLAPAMMRGSACPLTVSHFSRQIIDVTGICPRDRVSVLPNGADHMLGAVPAAGVLERWHLKPRGYAVMFGSPKRYKNVEVVMRAFGQPGLWDTILVVVGGTEHELVQAGIKAPANAVFTGPVSDGELRTLYQGAICVLMPSRTEGFGLPPVEAMQLGCPSVVAPAGAMPEVCRDAACYADTDDPAEWVQAVRALRDNEALRQAKVEAGRARAADYSWARAGECLLGHVLSLAGGDSAALLGKAITAPASAERALGASALALANLVA